ncbi:DUF3080 domain-containing protein [Vibrio sinaloensis]|uniref:DUF3080 domain-containing protein n=1 Tax=Photobacterium sp. (strain ATCC 43367) TaxID=379097 RepID=UPI0020695D39|nr:DUF3080 domain-containing protein [Vibrio sinaloensis]UPQ88737.1 DUF3080 domain-containing protein [Vibrio sinaloensis]
MLVRRPIFLIIVSVWGLIGCQPNNPGSMFDDYLTRVARVQDAPIVDAEAKDDFALPRKRELYIEIPSLSIGLLDSYQLRQCGLFNLIAERNSVLGKVADEFHNYDYQRQILTGLSRCLAHDDIEQTLKLTLADIAQQKRSQLTLHQWNLTYTSAAMQNQLKGSQWLTGDLGQSVTEVNQALKQLNSAFTGSDQTVIQAQEILDKQPILGRLNYSLVHATWHLDQVTRQLYAHDPQILCEKNRDKTKFNYLNNVFEQQYVAKVQPYMAQLDGYYQTLSGNLPLFEPKPNIHHYVYPLARHHREFRQATRRHVEYWQQLFKRCGRKVG